MEERHFWARAVAAIMVVSTVGAVTSRHINQGNIGWYWAMVMSLASGLVWGWMARKPVSLIYASVVYDVVYALTYVVCLALLGERLTLIQGVGVALAIVGMVLAGWN